MKKIGLTGGIGTGKTTVANIFLKNNIDIIDADKISREVLKIYPEINKNILNTFGNEFFDENNNLKRRELGNFVFKSEVSKKKLEDIIMPYIKKEINHQFNLSEKKGSKLCILDAPTLIEQNIYKNMDINILVWVDKETQINRVKQRDNLTYEQILNRINSQMNLDDKKKYVDFVIDNSKDISTTRDEVNKILTLIKKDEC